MSDNMISNDAYKVLKLIYKEYRKKLKNNSTEPDYFTCHMFNKKVSKINEISLNKSMSALFNADLLKPFAQDDFLLNDNGICYIQTHSLSYRFKKWLSSNIVSIIALVVSIASFTLSIISLLYGLQI